MFSKILLQKDLLIDFDLSWNFIWKMFATTTPFQKQF